MKYIPPEISVSEVPQNLESQTKFRIQEKTD